MGSHGEDNGASPEVNHFRQVEQDLSLTDCGDEEVAATVGSMSRAGMAAGCVHGTPTERTVSGAQLPAHDKAAHQSAHQPHPLPSTMPEAQETPTSNRSQGHMDALDSTNTLRGAYPGIWDERRLMDYRRILDAHKHGNENALEKLKENTKVYGPRSRTERLEAEECMVCLMELRQGSKVISLDCSHTFHEECILNWLATKLNQNQIGSCPSCNEKVLSPVPHPGGETSVDVMGDIPVGGRLIWGMRITKRRVSFALFSVFWMVMVLIIFFTRVFSPSDGGQQIGQQNGN